MKVYIVNGAPCSGKSLFEQNVLKLVPGYIYSSIDPIKRLAETLGWDGKKDEKGRKLLADLKRTLKEYNDYAYRMTIDNINGVYLKNCDVIFIDCREPDEIKKFCDYFNGKSILIRRSSAESAPTSNSSDRNVLDYDYDIVIGNNGSKADFAECAVEFIKDQQLKRYESPYYIDLFGDIRVPSRERQQMISLD